LNRTTGADVVIKAADRPGIRLFTVAGQVAYGQAAVPKGSWKRCTPESVAGFSAVGYHFGLKVHEDLKVPVGLVQCALGGTPAESWTSAGALRKLGDFDRQLDEVARLGE